jgi:hypothetical protein
LTRRFLFVFRNPGARAGEDPWTPAIYHDEPPAPAMLKQLPALLYRHELVDEAATWGLGDAAGWFRTRAAENALPASNMVQARRETGMTMEEAREEAARARRRLGFRSDLAAREALHQDGAPATNGAPFEGRAARSCLRCPGTLYEWRTGTSPKRGRWVDWYCAGAGGCGALETEWTDEGRPTA